MNAKKCKRLRQQARDMSVGAPEREYAAIRRQRETNILNVKTGERRFGTYRTNQAILVECERATYKTLKKMASPL